MGQSKRWAGLGGLAFAVAYIVSFGVASPPGGEYIAGDVGDFVAHGHRVAVVISMYLMLISVLGLLLMMGHFRDYAIGANARGRVFWGLLTASATSFFAGFLISLSPSLSQSVGGGPTIDPAVAYTFMQAGFSVTFVGGGVLLGCALLVLALSGGAAPTWLRAFAGIAGVLGLASPAYFPFFALILFGLVAGIWLLVSKEPAAAG